MRSVPESCQQFASLDTFRVAYLLRECLLSTAIKAKRLKVLEKENARLKKLVADLSLDKQILKEVSSGNF